MSSNKTTSEEIESIFQRFHLKKSSCLFIRFILSIETSNKEIEDFLAIQTDEEDEHEFLPGVYTYTKDKQKQSVLAGVVDYSFGKKQKTGDLHFAVIVRIGKPQFNKEMINAESPFVLITQLLEKFDRVKISYFCRFEYDRTLVGTRLNLPAKLEAPSIQGAELTGLKVEMPCGSHDEEMVISVSVPKDRPLIIHKISSTLSADLIPEIFIDKFSGAVEISEKFIKRG